MKTITLMQNEYVNFIKLCKELQVKFTERILKNQIEITAEESMLQELGYLD